MFGRSIIIPWQLYDMVAGIKVLFIRSFLQYWQNCRYTECCIFVVLELKIVPIAGHPGKIVTNLFPKLEQPIFAKNHVLESWG